MILRQIKFGLARGVGIGLDCAKIGRDMRALICIPLLVACSLPNIQPLQGGFWGKAAKPAVEQPITPLDSGLIRTQTLAPLSQTPQTKPPTLPQAVIPTPTSPEETACRVKGGQWGKAGKLAAMTCYISSKDAGKFCSKQSDCSSQCLARSKTCAPIWPIFGCSQVLQNDGSLVTLCID